jgi:hypothetical protein
MSDKRGPDAQNLARIREAARLAEAEPWGLSPDQYQAARRLIPSPIDQNPFAQSRNPMDMIRQG